MSPEALEYRISKRDEPKATGGFSTPEFYVFQAVDEEKSATQNKYTTNISIKDWIGD